MSQREGLAFSTPIVSDAAPLNHLIAAVLNAAPRTRCFRDPTRGGLASTLNEFAQASGVVITVDEDAVPVKPEVRGACEMLGYDVLQVANEGKMVAVVPAEEAQAALAAMRASKIRRGCRHHRRGFAMPRRRRTPIKCELAKHESGRHSIRPGARRRYSRHPNGQRPRSHPLGLHAHPRHARGRAAPPASANADSVPRPPT